MLSPLSTFICFLQLSLSDYRYHINTLLLLFSDSSVVKALLFTVLLLFVGFCDFTVTSLLLFVVIFLSLFISNQQLSKLSTYYISNEQNII
jgi:hypothetical protein